VHKAMSYCSKLLKGTDHCLAVLSCAHLYWQDNEEKAAAKDVVDAVEDYKRIVQEGGQHSPVRDSQGVLSCLKRALKIANAAQQQLAVVERKGDAASALGHFFVEILNSYVYFYDHEVESITQEGGSRSAGAGSE